MTCEEFYRHGPPPFHGAGDRCSRNEIDAATAQQVSILGLSTTVCGILNLFVAGWQIKTWGPRAALVAQTAFPALRVALQAVAVGVVGRGEGIALLQASQLIGLVGGVSGYLLVLNTAAGEVVSPSQRTAMFGRLQGSVMLGTAVGYLLGGIVGDAFGIGRPFEAATGLFLASSLYAFLFIPYIDPKTLSDGDSPRSRGLRSVLSPFRVLSPWRVRRYRSSGGAVVRGASSYYGVTFLALGVFLGVLATGYAPVLIQMYATAAFDFHPRELGYLMATNSLIRGVFLIFAFPRIISAGRRWFASSVKPGPVPVSAAAHAEYETAAIATAPEAFDPPSGLLAEQEPAVPPPRAEGDSGREFDLFFLRWSLVADGLVTAYTASATAGWHIYLGMSSLPFDLRDGGMYHLCEWVPQLISEYSWLLASSGIRICSCEQRRHHRDVPAIEACRRPAGNDTGRERGYAVHSWAVWVHIFRIFGSWKGVYDLLLQCCRSH